MSPFRISSPSIMTIYWRHEWFFTLVYAWYIKMSLCSPYKKHNHIWKSITFCLDISSTGLLQEELQEIFGNFKYNENDRSVAGRQFRNLVFSNFGMRIFCFRYFYDSKRYKNSWHFILRGFAWFHALWMDRSSFLGRKDATMKSETSLADWW